MAPQWPAYSDRAISGSQSSLPYDSVSDNAQEKHDRQSCAGLWSWDGSSTAAIHASGTATAFTTVATKSVGNIKCPATGLSSTGGISAAFFATAAAGISGTAACAIRVSSTTITALDFANDDRVADFRGFSRNIAGCAAKAVRRNGSGHRSWRSQ